VTFTNESCSQSPKDAAQEEKQDSEQQQLQRSLSKTDSLIDLKAFFSRDQLRCRTDQSEEGEKND